MRWSLLHDRRADGPPPLLHDRYEVASPIGQGRATVYRGTDTRLGRTVALKRVVLASGHESGEQVHLRALREARAAARLDHPSIVTVYDVVEEDDALWLVMELVDAPSLAQLVAEEGPLDHASAARVGLAVLGALTAAHREGIVHRDVKPANVLVPPDGVAKLADFGVATVRDETRVTATGLVVGSPAYMAPEQARGEQVGPAADLWALGATLYYAYEGGPPFDGGTALATASAVVHGEPRPERRPGPLSPLVARLLAKPVDARPSADEVRTELKALAVSPADPATPPNRPHEPPPGPPDVPTTEHTVRRQADPNLTPGAEPLPPTVPPPPDAAPGAPGSVDVQATKRTVRGPAGTAVLPGAESSSPGVPTGRAGVSPGEPEQERLSWAPAGSVDLTATRPEAVEGTATRPEPVELAATRAGAVEGTATLAGPGPGHALRRPLRTGVPRARLGWLIVVVSLVVALLAALAFDPDDLLPNDDGGTLRDNAGQVDERDGAATTTASTTATTATTAAPTTTAAAEPSEAAAGEVPAGWRTYSDPRGGYTVAYPGSWQVEPAGGPRVDFRDPESGSYLRVDWTDQPKPDPVADWRTQSQGFAASHQGYEEITIAPEQYRDYNAARWEFIYTDGGARLHAVDLGFVVGDKAYALFFQTKEENWATSQDVFDQIRESFRPAGG
jgi:serine/threonine protein kinase